MAAFETVYRMNFCICHNNILNTLSSFMLHFIEIQTTFLFIRSLNKNVYNKSMVVGWEIKHF